MIQSFASLATLLLASVFAIAAISKLTAPTKTRNEFAGLGIPAPGLFAGLVPIVELITVGLLIGMPRLGGLVSVLLISGFTAVLLNVLQSGRTVSCGCLGSLSKEPISYWTIARNGGLLTLAAATSAIESLKAPGVAVVLVSGSVLLLMAVAIQLIKLRSEIGTVWRITLAGEQAGEQNPEQELVLDLEIDLDQEVERLVPSNVYPANREG